MCDTHAHTHTHTHTHTLAVISPGGLQEAAEGAGMRGTQFHILAAACLCRAFSWRWQVCMCVYSMSLVSTVGLFFCRRSRSLLPYTQRRFFHMARVFDGCRCRAVSCPCSVFRDARAYACVHACAYACVHMRACMRNLRYRGSLL